MGGDGEGIFIINTGENNSSLGRRVKGAGGGQDEGRSLRRW